MTQMKQPLPPHEKVPPSWPLMKRMWRDWVSPYKRLIFINLLLIIGVSASTTAYPLVINWSIDKFEKHQLGQLAILPLVIILVTAAKGLTLYFHTSLTNKVSSLVLRDLQNAVFAALNSADLAQVNREAPANLAQRFYAEMIYIQVAIQRAITSMIRDSLMIIGLTGAMIYIDWQLALASLVLLPIAVVPVTLIGKKLRANAAIAQGMIGNMASFLTEALGGARIIRTYQLEPYMASRGHNVFDAMHHLRLRAANLYARVEPILEALGGFAVAIVILLIGWRISSGASSLGQFAGFISALLIAAQPMRTLGNVNAVLQEGASASIRIFALLDTKPQITQKSGAATFKLKTGEIRFENVSFSYGKDIPTLRDVSFTIPGGATVALVGRSGAGKSTLFNLIPRLYDISSGTILFDGQDISQLTLASLRQQISLVAQDVMVFQDSVASNIALGRLDATRSEIEAAANDAAAHDFIIALPQGYDTRLGEGGATLSGGERQRIALARALLRDTPLLLLDEATSALDAESEHLVQQALARLTKDRTTLVIAHRLATIRKADLIVVMEQGRVVEQGTHQTLLAQNGAYATLHQRQFHEEPAIPDAKSDQPPMISDLVV